MFPKLLFFTLIVLILFSCSHKTAEQITVVDADSTSLEVIENWLEFSDKIYASKIRSLQLQVSNGTYPILTLDKPKAIIISFDIWGEQKKDYQLAVIRCDINWTKELETVTQKDLIASPSKKNNFYTYAQIFNTKTIKYSGNYLIIVFEQHKEQPIITKRFLVSEEKLSVLGKVQRPNSNEHKNRYQEIKYKIALKDFKTENPFEDFKTVIVQNWQWQTAISNISPAIIQDDNLVYDYPKENLFLGGKEFRKLDLKQDNQKIIDAPRSFNKHQKNIDHNGLFSIAENSNYLNAQFDLKMASPLSKNEHIYIYGELSNWNINFDFELKYDTTNKAYKKRIQLKQGIYDYQYALVQDGKTIDLNFLEGSSYLTENKYHILVYQKMTNTYRLLAVKAIR